jgi:hypothetical protein
MPCVFTASNALKSTSKHCSKNTGITFQVHDLNQLLENCLPYDGTLELHRDLLKDLTRYAVEFRYPGESATKEDARTALRHMKTLRAFLRPKFK